MQTEKALTVLDERGNWWGPMIEAAKARGYRTERIFRGNQVTLSGLGFIRPHAIPRILEVNHNDYLQMAEKLTMVQDFPQVETYDDKSAQFWRWKEWMPPTWRFSTLDTAAAFLRTYNGTLVSKADVGASSKNVRVLTTREQQMAHVKQLFGKGIEVDHCAGGGPTGREAKSMQKGYVLFQEFIPHDVTWRVNAIGRGRAAFKRYNYPDRPVAQTGNVEPVMSLDGAVIQEVMDFADRIFDAIGTKWCALDILHDVNSGALYLLETSLGWPWPSPNDCMEAPFFGNIAQPREWAGMWELMLDEYEAGVWTDAHTEPSTTFA